MKNFKQGQKVVFKENGYAPRFDSFCVLPQENKTVVIKGPCPMCPDCGHWIIEGYEKDKLGQPQVLSEECLFPIEEQKLPLMKFTEILKKEESQILIDN